MTSIFTKIIQGDIPCHRVAENDKAIAFLDIRPLARGHCLVVPKREVDKLFDLPEADYLALWSLCKQVAQAVETCMPCNRVGVAVLGFEVPHAHVHLVPMRSEEDLNFSNPKMVFTQEEFAAIASKITLAITH
ncbi:MAG: HIT family protein [Flavobacteriales bacterium]|jgi:histidine triad (HIT) family protein|nr:HIT family protein [Flavobacteriales bacterium]MBT3572427.1 HIT family protein [Flavobacteriales bacterium]MBT3677568.1 HIT family protein [Flavobacteriales bacterium]MBT3739554.1 HIT family protein [Flavobacteriales bacterium]MBT4102156.1 HIT family protein [Flavobacteriales bacterium]